MKKLIVLATLAALPAVAMADVTISGTIGVGIQNTKPGQGGSVNDMNRASGEVKFAGSEDLGNGLKAVWQIANRIDPAYDEKTNAWGGRDTFVGLRGSYGQIRFGNNSNPTNSGFSGNADVFTVIGLHGDGSYKTGEARLAHSIRYDAPEYAGFKVAVIQQLKEGSGQAVAANTTTYSSGLGVSYNAGPVTLIYSNTAKKNGTVAGVTDKTNQFTAQASLGDVGVNFGYGDVKTGSGATQSKKRGFGVSATYALGAVTPMVGYWKEKDSKTGGVSNKDGYNVFSASVDYALSKRTNAGVEFQKQSEGKANAKDDKRIAAVYLVHNF
jgi:predicted porin